MKNGGFAKLALTLVCATGLGCRAGAQISQESITVQSMAPTGACAVTTTLFKVTNVGLWQCVGGVWTEIAPGGGGGGSNPTQAGVQNWSGSAWALATSAQLVAAINVSPSSTIAPSALPVFGTAQAGIVGASGGGTVNFLRADGSWATPPGAGSGSVGSAGQMQIVGVTPGTFAAGALTDTGSQLQATEPITVASTAGPSSYLYGVNGVSPAVTSGYAGWGVNVTLTAGGFYLMPDSPATGIWHASNTSGIVTNTLTAVNLASADVSGLLPTANIAALAANTVLGSLTAVSPSGLAVPSCSASNDALNWTSGVGFGCFASTFANLGAGTSAAALLVGTGGSINPTGSGVVNANEVNGLVLGANIGCVGTNASAQLVAGTCSGAGGITALTGDVTASGNGSVAATVVGIGGSTFASRATGVLFNTTGTGVITEVSMSGSGSILGSTNPSGTGLWQITGAASRLAVLEITGNGTAPTIAVGAGAGTGGSVGATISGTSMVGLVSITTGSTIGTTSSVLATVTFTQAFPTAPKACFLQPTNLGASTAGFDVIPGVPTTTTETLNVLGTAIPINTTLTYSMFCGG
jgi:hypothetical protein